LKLKPLIAEVQLHRQQIRDLQEKFVELASRYSVTVDKTRIDLPYHWRLSYETLESLGGFATAGQIADRTLKARAVESSYLNAMAQINVLDKKRIKRRIYFFIPQP